MAFLFQGQSVRVQAIANDLSRKETCGKAAAIPRQIVRQGEEKGIIEKDLIEESSNGH